jgi:4-hydroxy-tetrahydrodipicolinate synthase
MLRDGFYTALGTPLDKNGYLIESSFRQHLEDQISIGASGLLLLGSMGIQTCIRDKEYARIIRIASDAAAGRSPLFVGVMDNSIGRVKDRIKAAGGERLDGVVVTTPFYYMCNPLELQNFFSGIADVSKYPVYLYDLPGVTKTKITLDTVLSLMKDTRLAGIKTGDLTLARELKNHPERQPDFQVLFSGLELFDVAFTYGIRHNLDGMFCCTPKNTAKMYKYLKNGDVNQSIRHLDNILSLRKVFAATAGIFPSFTAAMNLLGYEGNFSPDYCIPACENTIEKIESFMKSIGEL